MVWLYNTLSSPGLSSYPITVTGQTRQVLDDPGSIYDPNKSDTCKERQQLEKAHCRNHHQTLKVWFNHHLTPFFHILVCSHTFNFTDYRPSGSSHAHLYNIFDILCVEIAKAFIVRLLEIFRGICGRFAFARFTGSGLVKYSDPLLEQKYQHKKLKILKVELVLTTHTHFF